MSGTRRIGRRGFLTAVSATAATGALATQVQAQESASGANPMTQDNAADSLVLKDAVVPFDGEHQAGINTPAQTNLNLIGFNFVENISRDWLRNLMITWTEGARSLTQGKTPLASLEPELVTATSNLTITVGLGPKAVELVGADPVAKVPPFKRDELDPAWGQTDVVLQICCDDPLMLSHTTRHMVRTGPTYAKPVWMQSGFLHAAGTREKGQTPRNLFGQLDGTVNPRSDQEFAEQVWRKDGSTVMVVRRIKMNMDTWEKLDRMSREVAMGRALDNGAPLSGGEEHTPADYTATDEYGLPVIDPASHMARARPPEDKPEQKLLRRAYNYDIPPAEEGLSNSGLVFICYQKDPDKQFTPIQKRLDEVDRLNEWITHIGSAVYWIPPGTKPDEYWAQSWLED